jgi:hypothetical protein
MLRRDWPLDTARWLLLAAIVLSAWLYGGTRPWTIIALTSLLLLAGTFYLLAFCQRHRPALPPWLVVVPSFLLLLQGWFMTWNASRRFLDYAEVFVDVAQPLPGWPGVVDAGLALPWMLRTTGLVAALWIACDLARHRVWSRRLWLTLAATGTSLMALGLAQRFSGATSIFWDTYYYTGQWFFATFRYHANAGAYINLVLPFIATLALRAFHREGAEKARVFWTLAALTTAACGFINYSRAAHVVTILLLTALTLWLIALRLETSTSRRLWRVAAFGLLGLTTVGILASSFDTRWSRTRWENTQLETLLTDGRPQVYQIMWHSSLPAAGPWGFGPGTFEPVFNLHRETVGSPLRGRWDFAHSDALQSWQDWGWVGAGAWFLLLFGGFLRALAGARRQGRRPTGQELLAGACALALGGIMLHACVDFPLQILSLQLYTMVIAGLAWGLPRHDPTARQRATPPASTR